MWLAICWSDFGLCRRAGWPRLGRKMSSARYRLVDSGVVSCPVKPRESDLLDIIIIVYHGVSFMYLLLSPRPYHSAVHSKALYLNLAQSNIITGGPLMIRHFYVSRIISGPNSQSGCGRAGSGPCSLISGDVWCCRAFFLSLQHCRAMNEARGQFLLSVTQSSN